jgi:hypothetical protein
MRRRFVHDLFHLFMTVSWPIIFASFAAFFFMFNLLFAAAVAAGAALAIGASGWSSAAMRSTAASVDRSQAMTGSRFSLRAEATSTSSLPATASAAVTTKAPRQRMPETDRCFVSVIATARGASAAASSERSSDHCCRTDVGFADVVFMEARVHVAREWRNYPNGQAPAGCELTCGRRDIVNWGGIVAWYSRNDDAAPLPPASRNRSAHRAVCPYGKRGARIPSADRRFRLHPKLFSPPPKCPASISYNTVDPCLA